MRRLARWGWPGVANRSIGWKLFIVISLSMGLPGLLLTLHDSASRISASEQHLAASGTVLTRALALQCGPALAFEDRVTAREAFAAAATDPDVAAIGLYRSDGRLLEARGPADAMLSRRITATVLERHGRDIRVLEPMTTAEGPTGTLVVDLSSARMMAESRRLLRTGVIQALLVLSLALGAAWLVGRSIGRRLGRVKAQARRIIAGELVEMPLADASSDEIGQLARAFHVMVGVVERKVEERTAALEASREQYRSLLETARTVPWRMSADQAWQFTYVGPQAAAMFGATAAEWLAPAFWTERLRPEDAVAAAAALARAGAEGTDQETEFRFRCDDGKELWIRMMIAAPGTERAPGGFMFDVTERRTLELELRQAQKLESVGRLAAGVAHEINTPIQFVSDSVHFMKSAFADLVPLLEAYGKAGQRLGELGLADEAAALRAAEETADLDYSLEEFPRAIDRTIEGLDRVAVIVKSMKEFAHPEGRERSPANINAALTSTLAIARNEYKYVADVETDLGELPAVSCYIGELNQAFLNILVNAAHAIGEAVGNSGQRGRIRVVTRCEGDEVVVSIGDSGGGIPEAIQANVFDPFFTTKEVGRGTGQGLAIARRAVVDRHGGDLSFESEVGRGTTFFIRIPVEPRKTQGAIERAA
jgi:PAS domain S-box-containing protein